MTGPISNGADSFHPSAHNSIYARTDRLIDFYYFVEITWLFL